MSNLGPARPHRRGLRVDELPVAVVLLEHGVIVEANVHAERLLAEPDLAGRGLTEFFKDSDSLDSFIAGESAVLVVRCSARPSRWLELISADSQGQMVVTLIDVTEAVRTQGILRESAWTVTVARADGRRLWGPVGREHPRDGPWRSDTEPSDRVHPEDLEKVLTAFQRATRESGGHESIHARLRDFSSPEGWTRGTVEFFNALEVPEVEGMILRVQDRHEPEEVASIGQTRSVFQSVAEAAPIGIVITGPAFNGAYFNPAVRKMLPGLGTGDGVRDWTAWVRAAERADLRAWLADVLAQPREESRALPFEVGLERPLWAVVTVAPRYDENSLLVGYIVTFQDVTAEIQARRELEEAQENLLHLASHDPLTGLANRTLLGDALGRIDAFRGGPTPEWAGMLFCDLDDFKAVNDQYGHDVGDRVLVEVAERLRRTARATDLVARLGGDEFIVLAAGDLAELEVLAGRIVAAVAEPIEVDGRSISVGVTIGTASAGREHSLDELLKEADAAMYRRKVARRR